MFSCSFLLVEELEIGLMKMRDYGIYLLNIVLIYGAYAYIIPDLSTELSDFYLETKTLKEYRIDEREYYRKLSKRIDYTLVLIMDDGTEWYISEQYFDYWNELKSEENIGKEFKLYTRNNGDFYHNPVQIEVDNEVIYDAGVRLKWMYLVLAMTIGLSIYSFITLKRKITNPGKEDIGSSGTLK